eukprot:Gb_35753 [translate_table: standard]
MLLVFGDGVSGQRMEAGSTLRPGIANQSFLTSPNTTFAFGFYSISSNSYGIGIWYYKIPGPFVVWTPSQSRNITVGSKASLQLMESGDLVLRDDAGSLVWRTNTSGKSVASGQILDSGNFVLRNIVSSAIVWNSFNHPADTLLPDQSFSQNTRLRTVGAPSRYSLGFQDMGRDIVFALFWNETKIYRNITVGSSLFSAVLDSSGRFAVQNASGNAISSWLSSDYQDTSLPLRRLTLDFDGNLRIYSWDAQARDWTVGWQALEDDCEVKGLCGPYGLCTYVAGKRSCICPPGFTAISSAENWASEGCRRLSPLDCSSPQVIRLENTVLFWDESDFIVGNSTSETGCRDAVQQTPATTGATFPNNGSGLCMQKRVSFISGYQLPSSRSVSFLRICGEALTSGPGKKDELGCSTSKHTQMNTVVRGLISASASLNAVMFLLFLVLYRVHRFKEKVNNDNEQQWVPLLFNLPGSPVIFSFKTLQDATADFKEKLGSGGFGSVYKGVLSQTNTPVAVKRLEDFHDQGDKEFRAEVALIGRTHHFNLVHLLGYCSEGPQRLLVYEYMPNGSLDRYLFHKSEGHEHKILDWKTRLNIAVGAARGIAYLHEECREPIVHCDIKPQNILLDANLRPKVSDFGLSKMIGKGRPNQHSNVRGSPGYMAPEWLADLPITCKADVFSFGIVLLEIVGGRSNVDPSVDEERRIYSMWAFRMAKEGKHIDVVDPELRDGIEDVEQVKRMLEVAFWCIQGDSELRPSMGRIALMLEGSIPVEGLPPTLDSKLFLSSSLFVTNDQPEQGDYSLGTGF